jgi:hypothetical protein
MVAAERLAAGPDTRTHLKSIVRSGDTPDRRILMAKRRKLGELLVEAGAISEHQLAVALAEQRKWNTPLGMILVRLDYLDEETLVRTLARQLEIPVAWLRGKQVDPEVLALIPAEIARKHRCLPLTVREEAGGRTLYLAMADPSDLESLDIIGFRVGFAVKPILVAPSELEDALGRLYDSPQSRESDTEALELETNVGVPAAQAVNQEPELLMFEAVALQAEPDVEEALEFVEEATPVVSKRARQSLTQLVVALVEEGALDREELIEKLSHLKRGEGPAT